MKEELVSTISYVDLSQINIELVMKITRIGIVRIHGGLIFLVFFGSLHPGIFILDKIKL